MNDFLISVIIPTYNRAHVLRRAIESVFKQNYKNFELIIVDDGSDDDTQMLLAQYSNIHIIKTSNQGVSSARNIGIQAAKGEWIAFLDSDDEWMENKLLKQVNYIQHHPEFKLVHGDEIWIRNGKRVNPKLKHQKGGGDQFFASLKLCAISPSVALIHKSLLNQFSLFREDYPCCEDYDLWLKITAQYKIGYIEEQLIKKYGGHEDQLSRKYKAMDFWRIKSIDWVIQNLDLSLEKKENALQELKIKCTILLKGYAKHANEGEDYLCIKDIYSSYFS